MKCTIDIPRAAFQNLYDNGVYKNYFADQIDNYFKFGYFEMSCINITNESISFDFDVKTTNGKFVIIPGEYEQMIKKEFGPKFNLEEEMRKLVVKDFEPHKDNYSLYYCYIYGHIAKAHLTTMKIPNTKYFTYESVCEFMSNISNREISAEEFFETYDKVFGGK